MGQSGSGELRFADNLFGRVGNPFPNQRVPGSRA